MSGSVRDRRSTEIWTRYCGTAAKAGGNRENKLRPLVTEGSYLLEQFRDALVVARGQGSGVQNASAGWSAFLETGTVLRLRRRPDRATGLSPLPGLGFPRGCGNLRPAQTQKGKTPHGFWGPDPCPRAWHPSDRHLQVTPILIRFERFPVFHTFTSGGGNDWRTCRLRPVCRGGF